MKFDSRAYWKKRHEDHPGHVHAIANRNRPAADLEESFRLREEFLYTTVIKRVPGGRILDAGCGFGRLANVFTPQRGWEYHGIDISPVAIAAAKERHPEAAFRVCDVPAYVVERPFDAVVSWSVFLHFVEPGIWEAALVMVGEAVRPGGYFVLVDTVPKTEQKTAGHVKLRTLAEYESALETTFRLRDVYRDQFHYFERV